MAKQSLAGRPFSGKREMRQDRMSVESPLTTPSLGQDGLPPPVRLLPENILSPER